jgi:pimeloyl-ACP methyl ester carboxylesterase
MQVLYLYGFASGPLSTKAQFFKHKFKVAKINFQIIDYIPNSNAFTQMKPSSLVKLLANYVVNHHSPREELILLGSSYGGLITTWFTFLNPNVVSKLFLMAPAINFTPEFISYTLGTSLSEWKQKGQVYVDHYRYNKQIPLNYSFIKDLQFFPPPNFSSEVFPVPTYIFHGMNDQVIPIKWSEDLADQNSIVTLFPLDGDHQLLENKEEIWMKIIDILKK